MTPIEANEEARVALANAKWDGGKARIETDVLECLLATTEREAKLRKSLLWAVRYIEDAGLGVDGETPGHDCDYILNPDRGCCGFHDGYWTAIEVLGEQKGGE